MHGGSRLLTLYFGRRELPTLRVPKQEPGNKRKAGNPGSVPLPRLDPAYAKRAISVCHDRLDPFDAA